MQPLQVPSYVHVPASKPNLEAASERTNIPLSSAHTWTPFHYPQKKIFTPMYMVSKTLSVCLSTTSSSIISGLAKQNGLKNCTNTQFFLKINTEGPNTEAFVNGTFLCKVFKWSHKWLDHSKPDTVWTIQQLDVFWSLKTGLFRYSTNWHLIFRHKSDRVVFRLTPFSKVHGSGDLKAN